MEAKMLDLFNTEEEFGKSNLVTALKKMEGSRMVSVGQEGGPTKEKIAQRKLIFDKNAGALQDHSKELLEYLIDIDGEYVEESDPANQSDL